MHAFAHTHTQFSLSLLLIHVYTYEQQNKVIYALTIFIISILLMFLKIAVLYVI